METSLTRYHSEINREEWYDSLLTECVSTIAEYEFISRWAKVEGYWRIGKIINDNRDNFAKSGLSTKQTLNKIAKDLGITIRVLYYASAFHRKYPDFNKIPGGKNITWTKIIQRYLPNNPPKEKKQYSVTHTCPACGWKF